MNWLTIDDLLLWCREIDNDDSRRVLTAIGEAVEINVEQNLNRPLFATQDDIDSMDTPPEYAMVVNAAIKQAAMLMVSHLNENREIVADVNLLEIPFGFIYLLNDYRIRSNP